MTASSTGRSIVYSVAYLNSFYKSCEALKTQEENSTVQLETRNFCFSSQYKEITVELSQQRRH